MDDVFFPLLRLPKDAHNNVLRTMDMDDIIVTSLCSKATLARIAALKFNLSYSVQFGEQLRLLISNLSFPMRQMVITLNEPLALQRTVDIEYTFVSNQSYYQNKRALQNVELSVREWLVLIRKLFKTSSPCVTFLPAINTYDRNWLRELFKGLKYYETVRFDNESTLASCLKFIFEMFRRAEHIQLSVREYTPKKDFLRVLMQNTTRTRLGGPMYVLNLDDLMIANCQELDLWPVIFSSKVLNQFLKLWMKGANSKLEYLSLGFIRNHSNMEKVLEGIVHQQMEPGEERRRRVGFTDLSIVIKNASVITRNDGTKASISLVTHLHNHLQFVVWN